MKLPAIKIRPFVILEILLISTISYFAYNVYQDSIKADRLTREKIEMIKLVYQLQDSSEDLTKFALSYVSTKDERYKDKFNLVAKIRAGKAPKPKNLNAAYWFLTPENQKKFHPIQPPESLRNRLEKLPFTKEEKIYFSISEDTSNALILLEQKAFNLVLQDKQAEAIAIIHSPLYLSTKRKIMTNIDKLTQSVITRINKEIEELHKERLHSILRLFIAIFLYIMIRATFKFD